jgi:hypothetical protein
MALRPQRPPMLAIACGTAYWAIGMTLGPAGGRSGANGNGRYVR